MELHSQTAAKKMWDYLRAVLFMLKVKSVISKRKLTMDVNIFMNRSKFIGKSITNLLAHKHHHSHHSIKQPSLLNEYEFSCNNSPNPLCFHAKKAHNKRGYFPCLNTPIVEGSEEQDADIRTPLRLEYTSQELCGLTTSAVSPFDARFADFSPMEGEGSSSRNGGVDSEAEEFIKRFYEQLKKQKEVGLLEYPQPQGEE